MCLLACPWAVPGRAHVICTSYNKPYTFICRVMYVVGIYYSKVCICIYRVMYIVSTNYNTLYMCICKLRYVVGIIYNEQYICIYRVMYVVGINYNKLYMYLQGDVRCGY